MFPLRCLQDGPHCQQFCQPQKKTLLLCVSTTNLCVHDPSMGLIMIGNVISHFLFHPSYYISNNWIAFDERFRHNPRNNTFTSVYETPININAKKQSKASSEVRLRHCTARPSGSSLTHCVVLGGWHKQLCMPRLEYLPGFVMSGLFLRLKSPVCACYSQLHETSTVGPMVLHQKAG